MRILPVLDLLNGVVVRGVAGKRGEYRPIQTGLAACPEPLAIARAFRLQFGLTALYVADLDAILHARPNLTCCRELADDGFELLVDAGLKEAAQGEWLVSAGVHTLIAGLETLPGPTLLAELCRRFGPERVVFSLDLKQGEPLYDGPAWDWRAPEELIDCAVGHGIGNVIVLDLAQVGVGGGVETLGLCRRIQAKHPSLRITTGGGVRGAADLEQLRAAGIEGVLVASALHDGRLSRQEIDRVSRPANWMPPHSE